MGAYILAFDLGTGGNKAALYSLAGECLAEAFEVYPTFYPRPGWHEQRPEDWWQAVVRSTRALLTRSGVNPGEIGSIGISGHSLGAVPLDRSGRLLRQETPLWSDARAVEQAAVFFTRVPEAEWYLLTGNGFPPPLYTVFKLMWYRDHEPRLFERTHCVLGTKDYINYRLTGRMATDSSYASGSGVYDLAGWRYSDRLVAASGLPASLLPEILPSTEVLGTLTIAAASELGLLPGVQVVAGGVDNSCMALGARNIQAGRVYNSLGSSSWIAFTSAQPVLDLRLRPFVFAAVIPGLFNSAVSVFSSGTSFRWVRDQLCPDLVQRAAAEGLDVYDLMTAQAAGSPPGARGVLFNPSLAGGASTGFGIHIRGAYLGLDLGHTRPDLLRAAMEGIALGLRQALDGLRSLVPVGDELLVVGGGSRSRLWRQIYADVYRMRIVKTDIDQQAAALGAAALAAVGTGLWDGFAQIDAIHRVVDVAEPVPAQADLYDRLLPVYQAAGQHLADLGSRLAELDLFQKAPS